MTWCVWWCQKITYRWQRLSTVKNPSGCGKSCFIHESMAQGRSIVFNQRTRQCADGDVIFWMKFVVHMKRRPPRRGVIKKTEKGGSQTANCTSRFGHTHALAQSTVVLESLRAETMRPVPMSCNWLRLHHVYLCHLQADSKMARCCVRSRVRHVATAS